LDLDAHTQSQVIIVSYLLKKKKKKKKKKEEEKFQYLFFVLFGSVSVAFADDASSKQFSDKSQNIMHRTQQRKERV
jgi:hypothetical protein